MTIKQIRKQTGCCAWIDKLLLSYNANMEEIKDKIKEAKDMKTKKALWKKRFKITALYRGQLLSLINDFQNNKL